MGRLRLRWLRRCCRCRCFSPTVVAAMGSPEVMALGGETERSELRHWSGVSALHAAASPVACRSPSAAAARRGGGKDFGASPFSPRRLAHPPYARRGAPLLHPAGASSPAHQQPADDGDAPARASEADRAPSRAPLLPAAPASPSARPAAAAPSPRPSGLHPPSRGDWAVPSPRSAHGSLHALASGLPGSLPPGARSPLAPPSPVSPSPGATLDSQRQFARFAAGRGATRPRYATAPEGRHARALAPSDLRVRAPRLAAAHALGTQPAATTGSPGSASPGLSSGRLRRQRSTFERFRQQLKTRYFFPSVAASEKDDWATFREQMIEESERERLQHLQKEEFESLSPRERALSPNLYLFEAPPLPALASGARALGAEGEVGEGDAKSVLAATDPAARAARLYPLPPPRMQRMPTPQHVEAEAQGDVAGGGSRACAEAYRHGASRLEDEDVADSPPADALYSTQKPEEVQRGLARTSSELLREESGGKGREKRRKEREYAVAPAAKEKGSLAAVVQQKKNALHKRIWGALRKKKFRVFEDAMAELEAANLRPDEVTFTLHLYGTLLSSRHENQQAWEVLEQMKAAKVHPTLVRYNERVLTSFMELAALDAEPHPDNIKKLLRASWLLAALVRNRRQRYIARKNAALREEGVGEEHLLCLHDLGALWVGSAVDPLLPRAAQLVLLQERLRDQSSRSLSAGDGAFPLLGSPEEQNESREAEIAALAAVVADARASVQSGALAAAAVGAAEALSKHPLFGPHAEGRGLTAEFCGPGFGEAENSLFTAGGAPLEALPFDDRKFDFSVLDTQTRRPEEANHTVSVSLPSWTVDTALARRQSRDSRRVVSSSRRGKTKHGADTDWEDVDASDAEMIPGEGVRTSHAHDTEHLDRDEETLHGGGGREDSFTGTWDMQTGEEVNNRGPSLFFEKGKVRVRNWRHQLQKPGERELCQRNRSGKPGT
ncbi:hypothetical protein BESB_078190 [Besnoitia besnoiti]|uniref:Uncharacterized protein n=1 Tax=Besnoitia besnoiti TaxID=94643 RepID=A0A2A9MD48_BESBE|nr:hypothetical protein BESB_078190 [Besnoitia besnoiti]PFH33603.1 hypothetical protein BESB_078190 [Besnoitia besnoiti]